MNIVTSSVTRSAKMALLTSTNLQAASEIKPQRFSRSNCMSPNNPTTSKIITCLHPLPQAKTAIGQPLTGIARSNWPRKEWRCPTAVNTASLKPTCTGPQLTWCSLLKTHWDATRVTPLRVIRAAWIGKPSATPAIPLNGGGGINDQHEIFAAHPPHHCWIAHRNYSFWDSLGSC